MIDRRRPESIDFAKCVSIAGFLEAASLVAAPMVAADAAR
jgi:hypothetical protein